MPRTRRSGKDTAKVGKLVRTRSGERDFIGITGKQGTGKRKLYKGKWVWAGQIIGQLGEFYTFREKFSTEKSHSSHHFNNRFFVLLILFWLALEMRGAIVRGSKFNNSWRWKVGNLYWKTNLQKEETVLITFSYSQTQFFTFYTRHFIRQDRMRKTTQRTFQCFRVGNNSWVLTFFDINFSAAAGCESGEEQIKQPK